ncbi:hypothetical protein JW960_06520 [candidate division KSB1 bacterium]|nr:hypothetical protein [candidate division KSB1 bacterium]
MKLTPKNSINLDDLQVSTDMVAQTMYRWIVANIEPLPVQINIGRNSVNQYVIDVHNDETITQTIPIRKIEFQWMLDHIRFVKRRCFLRMADYIIGMNIFKNKGLIIDKITRYSLDDFE